MPFFGAELVPRTFGSVDEPPSEAELIGARESAETSDEGDSTMGSYLLTTVSSISSRVVEIVLSSADSGGFGAPQLPQKFSSVAICAPQSLHSTIVENRLEVI